MFSQNEFLCPFEALKRDDVSEINKFLNISAASQDTFQRNNTKKKHTKLLTDFINLALNESIQSEVIPSCTKWTDVNPFFKKGMRSQIDNYSITVSILPEFIETI